MRKLTGYIGALIIVFALAGSILAGYALNVNGSSTIINEYEKVTDVSGLYTHTQEPTYIDYNPASNYIGYGFETSVYENTGLKCHKMIVGDTATITNSQITFNDKTYANVDDTILWCHVGFLIKSGNYLGWRGIGHIGGISSFTITKTSETSYTIQSDFGTENWTNSDKLPIFIYYPYDDYDSVGPYNGQMIYYNNLSDDIFYAGSINPAIPNGDERFVAWGTWGIRTVPGNLTSGTLTASAIEYTNEQDVGTGVKQANVRVYNSITSGGITYSYGNQGIFTNRYVYPTDSLGINYTESNRVNNYLMETTYTGGTTQTITSTLNLSPGMGLTDYSNNMAWGNIPKFWRANSMPYTYNGVSVNIGLPTYTSQDVSGYADNIKVYDLADILNYYNIPTDRQIIIKPYGTSNYLLDNGESIGDNNFTKLNGGAYGSPGFMDDKWYCVYHPETGTYEYYDKTGVKMQTRNTCYVGLCGSVPRYGPIVDYDYNIVGYYDFGARPVPHIDITYETETGGTTTYHYADITKGFSIKNDNVADVIWDNQYSNGDIKVLFRAENSETTYHNDLVVGDNTISVDYFNNGYQITLNDNDPVNVGKWRNIVLDIDLRNGELSVIPVRTFNSYTNVVLDVTNIFIGNLVNPTPTNIIKWSPTSISLTFNVYTTSVFMDTYGVVMVNPSLNVTDYFTDLFNFYKLKLYNFSVLGSSITINGVTADVSNNNITIDGQTVQIKDMSITYADGHAYISDSNATIDLGEIVDNTVSMTGNWYFETELLRGYTSTKMVYDWNWSDFILNNTQFCIMYIGIALVGLIVARRYCSLSITDYIVLIVSFAIALTVQVVG